jgi:NTP pyrophosphatase (non-canonical NTP hydrolase)
MSLNEAYLKFVDGVTSEASKNDNVWIERIKALETDFEKVGMSGQIARLTTASFGLNGEAAEVSELVKKILFHGKPMTQEIKEKLIDECSDVCWYVANLCIALGVNLNDVLTHNIEKLESRYPGGKFSIERSENRLEK